MVVVVVGLVLNGCGEEKICRDVVVGIEGAVGLNVVVEVLPVGSTNYFIAFITQTKSFYDTNRRSISFYQLLP